MGVKFDMSSNYGNSVCERVELIVGGSVLKKKKKEKQKNKHI